MFYFSTQAPDLQKKQNLQKKLFEDTLNPVNDDEIMDICSGNFISQIPEQSQSTHSGVTDTQIIDICSGAFETQPIGMERLESQSATANLNDEASQDISLILDEDNETCPSLLAGNSNKVADISLSTNSKSPKKVPAKVTMDSWLSKIKKIDKKSETPDSDPKETCTNTLTTQSANDKKLEMNETTAVQSKENDPVKEVCCCKIIVITITGF